MSSAHPQSSSQPLIGRRILVTRATPQAGDLTALLQQRGAAVTEIPVIEICPPQSYAPLDGALAAVAGYQWLILTSVNGVEAMFARMAQSGIARGVLAHVKICAIGPATRRALKEHGLKVALVPSRYVAESVVEALCKQVSGQRVLLVRAAVARDVIPQQLRECGGVVDVVEAYQTLVPAGSAQRMQAALRDPQQRPHAITFTSSSTARNLVEMLGGSQATSEALRGIKLASIGPVTSSTLRELGLRPDIEAAHYHMPGLVRALVKSFSAT